MWPLLGQHQLRGRSEDAELSQRGVAVRGARFRIHEVPAALTSVIEHVDAAAPDCGHRLDACAVPARGWSSDNLGRELHGKRVTALAVERSRDAGSDECAVGHSSRRSARRTAE